MDLFSTITDEIKPVENLLTTVREVCDFVSSLDPVVLKEVKSIYDDRPFEDWERIARSVQAFAYGKGLKNEWWDAMDLAREKLNQAGWTSGWDAAFDYIAASIIEPWVGTAFSSKDHSFMKAPLRAVGLS